MAQQMVSLVLFYRLWIHFDTAYLFKYICDLSLILFQAKLDHLFQNRIWAVGRKFGGKFSKQILLSIEIEKKTIQMKII